MKKKLIFIILFILVCSCSEKINRRYIGDRLLIKIAVKNQTLQIMNAQDIINYMNLEKSQKEEIKLISVNIDSNQVLGNILNEFPNLAEIDFYNCNGLELSQNNTSVRKVKIVANYKVIKNLHQLENVGLIEYDCAIDNQINLGIFDEFKKMKHLKCLELDLRENTILNNDFGSFDSLEVLRLNYASFEEIPKSISKLKNLTTLAIHTDFEVKIPKCILKMKSLKQIYFTGNHCVVYKFNTKYKKKYPNLQVLSVQSIPDLDKKYDYLKIKWN